MRLIDADALIEFMDGRLFDLREMYGNYDHYTDGFECALCLAEDALTIDAVPVVRCQYCKHRIDDNDFASGHYCAKRPSNGGRFCEDNDFCSYGERRDDE